MTKIFEEYATLKRQERILQEKISILGEQVKNSMIHENVNVLSTKWGTITLYPRTVWKYTDAVKRLQEREKKNGKAISSLSTVLTFTGKKA